MSQMYKTKSLKPNFLSLFSLTFIGLPFLCSEMVSLNLRFSLSLSLLKMYWAVFRTQSFCRCELSFLAEYLRVIPPSANLRLLTFATVSIYILKY